VRDEIVGARARRAIGGRGSQQIERPALSAGDQVFELGQRLLGDRLAARPFEQFQGVVFRKAADFDQRPAG
jgi:hypothetical protein